MSKILKLTIMSELEKCTNICDIEAVRSKYTNAFSSNIDVEEFNRILKEFLTNYDSL